MVPWIVSMARDMWLLVDACTQADSFDAKRLYHLVDDQCSMCSGASVQKDKSCTLTMMSR